MDVLESRQGEAGRLILNMFEGIFKIISSLSPSVRQKQAGLVTLGLSQFNVRGILLWKVGSSKRFCLLSIREYSNKCACGDLLPKHTPLLQNSSFSSLQRPVPPQSNSNFSLNLGEITSGQSCQAFSHRRRGTPHPSFSGKSIPRRPGSCQPE